MSAAEVEAAGAVATPIVVAVLGFVISRRLSRSTELLKVRLDYYRELMPDLNTLMCCMTFIGTWRDVSPVEVIQLKRRLDATFFCAAPLFSSDVIDAYDDLMKPTFATFNNWGDDAKIKSSAYRRRQSWRGEWKPEWDGYFQLPDDAIITAEELADYRKTYDHLVATIVADLNINRARKGYTTNQVSLNAHAPRPRDVTGSGTAP